MHMTADFDKPYTDWSIDVGSYKYEGITNNSRFYCTS